MIRKKEEMRKQMQVDTYKKRLEEENRRAEEQERRRNDRAEERKKALEDWHKNKTGNERGSMPLDVPIKSIVASIKQNKQRSTSRDGAM